MKRHWGAYTDDSSLSQAEVADCEVFRLGFISWLVANGIFPSVTYADLGGAGEECRRCLCPDEIPRSPQVAQNMKQTPLLVSNHVCYLDGMILAAVLGAPRVLAMKG